MGNALHELCLVYLEGNFGNDDGLTSLGHVFDSGFGPHHETSTTMFVSGFDSATTINIGPGWKIRAFHKLQQVLELSIGIVDAGDGGFHNLSQVVRWNLGCHPNGYAIRAIDQQIRNACRKDRRLLRFSVKVIDKVHSFLVDVGHHFAGNPSQTAFGVAVGRGRITIYRAEISLAIHQRIPHIPGLRHAHQGVIDGGVAVRMVFFETFAYHAGTLAVALVVLEPFGFHGIEDAPMHRLETVADIGQSAANDHRHGIVEIRPPHLLFNVDGQQVGSSRRAGWKIAVSTARRS